MPTCRLAAAVLATACIPTAPNGVPDLSVLDCRWIEACIEGVTGWWIGRDGDGAERHAAALRDQLDHAVLPLYATDPARWRSMMKQAIANITYYFNSQRIIRRYAAEVYLR